MTSSNIIKANRQLDKPALSAIIIIPDTFETVRSTIKYLREQTIVDQIEIIFVVPSLKLIVLDENYLDVFHSWRAIEIGSITSTASAFVSGIRSACAPIVALNEDHSFPDANWAESLIIAHRGPWAAVAPLLLNGNPVKMLSWADHYQAHHEWCNRELSGEVSFLPWHNSSYKRDILLQYGQELENLMQVESFLHRDLRSKGYRLLLESNTCNKHLSIERWSDWIPARYYVGRQYAGTWSKEWSWPRRLLFAIASPSIPFIRMWRAMKNIRREKPYNFIIRLLPIMLTGLAIEGFGHMVGYIASCGDSNEKLIKYDFHRVKTNKQRVFANH